MSKPDSLQYGRHYHIYNRGNNRENVFIEERNYAYFLSLYAKYIEPMADTFAYCLLRNHFHFLVRIKTEDEILNPKGLGDPSGFLPNPSQQFGNLFDAYAKAINKAYHRTGSLFEHPFGRVPVTTDAYLVNLVHYIHLNPQKHGFVTEFAEYPYSSYAALRSHQPSLLKRQVVLDWFNGKAAFDEFHQRRLDEKAAAPFIGDDPD
jgi:putative transposase